MTMMIARYETKASRPISERIAAVERMTASQLRREYAEVFGEESRTFRCVLGYDAIVSYKRDRCESGAPPRACIVNFHGTPKPCDLKTGWVAEAIAELRLDRGGATDHLPGSSCWHPGLSVPPSAPQMAAREAAVGR